MIRILHLYYDLMNLYGEYGNVVVLKKHLEDQDEEVVVDKKTVGDDIKFDDYDLVYCGAGSESHKKIAKDDFLLRKTEFTTYVNSNKLVLFTGNAMEFAGDLDLIDLTYEETKNRYVGDVIADSKEFGFVVGFINRCTKVKIPENASLFKLKLMFSDGKKYPIDIEGYHLKNLYGTYIIGPILTKNPVLLRSFVVKLLGGKEYKDISYPYEDDSYNVTLKALSEIK